MSKNILITVSVLLGLGIISILASGSSTDTQNNSQNLFIGGVSQEGDLQRIKILALGGYTPSQINAVANKETILEIETKGTYDCSSSINIPSLNYRKNLAPTGTTEVKIPASQAKSSIDILCSMGMYSTKINFNL